MSKNLITEARELCERATGGPWTGEENTGVQTATGKDVFQTGCGCCTSSHLSADDAAFIARSRTLIPELCDALEKAMENDVAYYKITDNVHYDEE